MCIIVFLYDWTLLHGAGLAIVICVAHHFTLNSSTKCHDAIYFITDTFYAVKAHVKLNEKGMYTFRLNLCTLACCLCKCLASSFVTFSLLAVPRSQDNEGTGPSQHRFVLFYSSSILFSCSQLEFYSALTNN